MHEKHNILFMVWTEYKPALFGFISSFLAFFNIEVSHFICQIDALSFLETSLELIGKIFGTFSAILSAVYILIKINKERKT